MTDVGEPSCFACGWMATAPDEPPVLWRVWNRASLQRCHLVPAALGGSDDLGNLVLLCALCHAAAPDVGDPEYMLRWIQRRESWGGARLGSVLQTAIAASGVADADLDAFNRLPARDQTALFERVFTGWSVAVAGRFADETVAACGVEIVRRACQQSRR